MDLSTLAMLFGGLAGLTFGGMRYLTNRDARRTRRVLKKARVVPISQLVDGELACVVGRVEIDGDPIESLILRKPCVAFDTVTHVQQNEYTVTTRVMRRLVPFYIVDATGRVRIDAPEVALCNDPAAKNERYVERIVENGARIKLVGSVQLDPILSTNEHTYREGGFKARLTGTAKFPLLADILKK